MDVRLLVMDLLFGTPAAGPAVGPRAGLGVGRLWRAWGARAWGAWGGRCGVGGMLLWIQQLDRDQFAYMCERTMLKVSALSPQGVSFVDVCLNLLGAECVAGG